MDPRRRIARIRKTCWKVDQPAASRCEQWKSGFTLVELLVVIAIIGVLVGLLLPAVQAAREAARRNQCLNQHRQISIGAMNYESAFGHFPPSTDSLDPNAGTTLKHEYSWTVFLLPYVEQQVLWDTIDKSQNWSDPINEIPTKSTLSLVRCPSRGVTEEVNLNGPGGTSGGFGIVQGSELRSHIMAVLGANTEFDATIPNFCTDESSPYTMAKEEQGSSRGTPPCITGNFGPIANSGVIYRYSRTTIGQIEDGTSNTFLVGESAFGDPEADVTRPWICGSTNGKWMYAGKNVAYTINSGDKPGPLRNNVGFGSEHPGGCHFAMSDGSATYFSENVELRVLYNLASRNDGQIIDYGSL
ncbi:DUF1559 domain-containing protein [Adhaeretor mobilis]|uniref:DUF1559 domain-containing protein n=1 Tax=Adhaeretor mobilis TaxID=1930276 RepID=A0A517N1B2_9BACT|nr:DUF1559 domain-containing protein [Adhaeretor mobilis]QDT00924.1 hypothetical protein HG15A2_42660 [Adhaeretor mobilis]